MNERDPRLPPPLPTAKPPPLPEPSDSRPMLNLGPGCPPEITLDDLLPDRPVSDQLTPGAADAEALRALRQSLDDIAEEGKIGRPPGLFGGFQRTVHLSRASMLVDEWHREVLFIAGLPREEAALLRQTSRTVFAAYGFQHSESGAKDCMDAARAALAQRQFLLAHGRAIVGVWMEAVSCFKDFPHGQYINQSVTDWLDGKTLV